MTTTANKGFTVPTVNGDFGTWGTELNGDLAILDTNLGGSVTVSVAGSANVTASAGNAQSVIQNLTGAITANIQYILPSVGGFYYVSNNTTGNFTVTVVTAGFSGVTIPQGTGLWVVTGGTTVVPGSPQGWQTLGTFTAVNATSQAFSLPVAYRRFRVTLQAVSVSVSGAIIQAQLSSNGGSSFVGSGYDVISIASTSKGSDGAVTPTGGSALNAPQMNLTTGLEAASGVWDGVYHIFPGSAAAVPYITGTGSGFTATPAFTVQTIGNVLTGVGSVMNAIGLFPSAGTFSGTMILEGLA